MSLSLLEVILGVINSRKEHAFRVGAGRLRVLLLDLPYMPILDRGSIEVLKRFYRGSRESRMGI